ncbi:hypothetical protein SOVF_137080, partial [Spinacia oleracea]
IAGGGCICIECGNITWNGVPATRPLPGLSSHLLWTLVLISFKRVEFHCISKVRSTGQVGENEETLGIQ